MGKTAVREASMHYAEEAVHTLKKKIQKELPEESLKMKNSFDLDLAGIFGGKSTFCYINPNDKKLDT